MSKCDRSQSKKEGRYVCKDGSVLIECECDRYRCLLTKKRMDLKPKREEAQTCKTQSIPKNDHL